METICRLCAEVLSADDIICTINDIELNIRQKLIDCCRWDELHDTANDFYPKNICKTCYGRLEICWNFSRSVTRAQFKIFKLVEGGVCEDIDLDFVPVHARTIHADVHIQPESCFVEDLPIVNPVESTSVKVEIDVNPIDIFENDALSTDERPIEISPSKIPGTLKNVKKETALKKIEPAASDSDSELDCKDAFGSTASLSSHDDDPMDARSGAAAASANAAIAANSANIKMLTNANNTVFKQANKSKLLQSRDFIALIKDRSNEDGSVRADAIKEHQLVNWTLLQETCWICKWPAPDRPSLRIHIRDEHPSEDIRTMCMLCGKSFKSRHPLMRHTMSEHYPYLDFW